MASAISGSQKRYPQISFGRRVRGLGQGGNALLTVRTIEKPKSNLFKAGRTSFNGVAASLLLLLPLPPLVVASSTPASL